MSILAAFFAAQTAMSIIQARQQTKAAKALASYNQGISQSQATQIRAGVAEEQYAKRQDLKRLLLENEARTAASGVKYTGSPIQHELQVIDDISRDITLMGHNAELEARGLESQAQAYSIQRDQASKAGRYQIGQALIGGVAAYYSLKKPKPEGLLAGETKVGGSSSKYYDVGGELGR